jgi:hypothetical protein
MKMTANNFIFFYAIKVQHGFDALLGLGEVFS